MIQDKVSGAIKSVEGAVEHVEEAVAQSRRIHGSRLLFRGIVWVVVYVLAIWVLADRSLLGVNSLAARVAIGLAPTPFFAWWLITWVKGVLRMDELQRRIELEALAFAFPTTLIFLAALGILDSAIALTRAEFPLRHAWLMMPMLYYVGLWNAQRRYA